MADNLYNPGSRIRLSVIFEAAGAEADPTTVALKVRDPAGATVTYNYPADITREAVGRFYMDLTVTAVGRWFYKFLGTGAVIATSADETFRVRASVLV